MVTAARASECEIGRFDGMREVKGRPYVDWVRIDIAGGVVHRYGDDTYGSIGSCSTAPWLAYGVNVLLPRFTRFYGVGEFLRCSPNDTEPIVWLRSSGGISFAPQCRKIRIRVSIYPS